MKRKALFWIAIAGLVGLIVGSVIAGTIVWRYGGEFVTPASCHIGSPPSDLQARHVEFQSDSGNLIRGWFAPGRAGQGGILLLHGFRGNRLHVVDHARFLHRAGYSVLLIDLQAHGESQGEAITIGYLEALDARSAIAYLKTLLEPSEPAGALGISLGGAACILGPDALAVDALVIEEVFATIEEAVENRIKFRIPRYARLLRPLLLWQLYPRLRISNRELRPIDKISRLKTPLLTIVGTHDPYTPLEESKRLFSYAPEPKELWEVEGALHQSLYHYAPEAYRHKVLQFFERYLNNSSQATVPST